MKKLVLITTLVLFIEKVISDKVTESSHNVTKIIDHVTESSHNVTKIIDHVTESSHNVTKSINDVTESSTLTPSASSNKLNGTAANASLPALLINYSGIRGSEGTWQLIPDHDLSGGVIRVSGDGPKSDPADPISDVGLETFSPAEKLISHPNYRYLSPLSECGFPAIMDQYDKDVDLKDDILEIVDKEKGDTETRVKRIVGGKVVPPQRHPWMVQLYLFNISSSEHYFHCAGTLISNRTILTAAHCLTRLGPQTTMDVVVIGNVDRRKIKFCKTSNPEEDCSRSLLREIEDFEVHDDFSEGNLNHDIALIYLRKPIKINAFARPICLPYTSELLETWNDLKLTALGWGSTNRFGTQGVYLSDVLKQVQFDLQPRTLCDKFHQRMYGRIKHDRICTGGNSGLASCNGDSGGAVVKALEIPDMNGVKLERVFQFGVVSAGGHTVETCGFQGRPSIDTNVFYFMDWILNHAIPGVSSYNYVQNYGPATWVESSSDAKTQDDNDFGVYLVPQKGVSQPEYLNELSTGKNVDVADNPKVALLASIKECGIMPTWKEQTFVEGDKKLRETESTLESHITESIGENEDVVTREKRIVGGVPLNIVGYYPWMAQIYARNVESNEISLRCSGSIISKRHILTAAHCVTEIQSPFVFDSVLVGQYNRNSTQECVEELCFNPISAKIAEIAVHSDYEKFTHKNNIALVKLAEDLNFTRMVRPICLPRREMLINGIQTPRYFTAGWGRIQRENSASSDILSEILLQMHVNILPRRDCDFVYSRSIDVLDRSRICGGGKASQGECLGDGGSPLMKKMVLKPGHVLNNKFFQFGVVSFADCGMQGMPTVYMNIIYYMDWILQNLDGTEGN